ncbi:hypothetical protein GGR52DRAFT_570608 [Hypoxylon sp. FL1284]|nr:hypothetical protein GGR52DRAFT_570608 [Hypoxylon sp. FL1284]
MIGSVGGFREHAVVPVPKFIDFGLTSEITRGTPDNAFRISSLMFENTTRQPIGRSRVTSYQGYETRATEILPDGNGARYPSLDPDLRDLLARCLARDSADWPDLAVLLRVAEDAVRVKTAAAYPGRAEETDEGLRGFVRELVLDADTS